MSRFLRYPLPLKHAYQTLTVYYNLLVGENTIKFISKYFIGDNNWYVVVFILACWWMDNTGSGWMDAGSSFAPLYLINKK